MPRKKKEMKLQITFVHNNRSKSENEAQLCDLFTRVIVSESKSSTSHDGQSINDGEMLENEVE
jgi:hypothetical protein